MLFPANHPNPPFDRCCDCPYLLSKVSTTLNTELVGTSCEEIKKHGKALGIDFAERDKMIEKVNAALQAKR